MKIQDVVALCAIAFILGMVLGGALGRADARNEAVRTHVAHYDTATGYFKWGAP